jgi:hypothetical protein
MKKILLCTLFTKQFNICLLSLSFVFVVACQQKAISQQSIKTDLSHELIKLETDRIFDKLVKIRRDFHENPELAGIENNTQKVIKQYLLALGIEVKTDIYG